MKSWTRGDLPAPLNKALDRAIDRGAKAPTVLRMTEKAGYTDWVMLISARSERNVRGVVEGIQEVLSENGIKPLGSDGLDDYLWALLDYDDFMIHVFYHPVRSFYDLESMWNDAPRAELELPEDVQSADSFTELSPPDQMPSFRGSLTFGGFADEFDDDDDDGDEENDPAELDEERSAADSASSQPDHEDASESENDHTDKKETTLEDELFDS